jgi:hypothetical protein
VSRQISDQFVWGFVVDASEACVVAAFNEGGEKGIAHPVRCEAVLATVAGGFWVGRAVFGHAAVEAFDRKA